jgi:hypothetical protein
MARADLGDLGRIILRLEEGGRLIRAKSEVDPVHDLAGVAAKLEWRGPRSRSSGSRATRRQT